MRQKVKILFKILCWTLGAVALAICFYIGYVFSKFNKDIDQEAVNAVVQEIKKAKKWDTRLFTMYDRIYDHATQNSSMKHAWKMLWGNRIECPCLDVVRRFPIKKRHRLTENTYAIGNRLETKVSQEDCLNYLFHVFDYLYNAKGIEEAALVYFNKPINELTDDELVGLIIMQENPSLYNPKKNKERFERKIMKVKETIQL